MATRVQHAAQHANVQPQDGDGLLHVPQGRFEFRGPFFRSDEACAYLGYRGQHARRSLYRFLAAQGINTARRHRTLLIRKTDLDRAIGAHGR